MHNTITVPLRDCDIVGRAVARAARPKQGRSAALIGVHSPSSNGIVECLEAATAAAGGRLVRSGFNGRTDPDSVLAKLQSAPPLLAVEVLSIELIHRHQAWVDIASIARYLAVPLVLGVRAAFPRHFEPLFDALEGQPLASLRITDGLTRTAGRSLGRIWLGATLHWRIRWHLYRTAPSNPRYGLRPVSGLLESESRQVRMWALANLRT